MELVEEWADHTMRPRRTKKWLRQPRFRQTEGRMETDPLKWRTALQLGLSYASKLSWMVASQPQGQSSAADHGQAVSPIR